MEVQSSVYTHSSELRGTAQKEYFPVVHATLSDSKLLLYPVHQVGILRITEKLVNLPLSCIPKWKNLGLSVKLKNCLLSFHCVFSVCILNWKTKVRGILCDLLRRFQKSDLCLILRSYRNRLFGHWLITMEKPKLFQEETKGGKESRLATQERVCVTEMPHHHIGSLGGLA